MILALAGLIDAEKKAFDPTLRNQLRKRQKSGPKFKHDRFDLVDNSYGIFARNRRDVGTPVCSEQCQCASRCSRGESIGSDDTIRTYRTTRSALRVLGALP
jgi:hypothetical protein